MNAVEIDHAEEDERVHTSMIFFVWSIFASMGVMWLTSKLHWFVSKAQQFFGQEGGRDIRVGLAGLPGLTIERSAELRKVGCRSMSTWLGGPKARYSPTRVVDPGVFVNRLRSLLIEK